MPKPPGYLKQLEHELLALGDHAMLWRNSMASSLASYIPN